MIQSNSRPSLPGVVPSLTRCEGAGRGGLLGLCLGLGLAVLPANAASPGTVAAWGSSSDGEGVGSHY